MSSNALRILITIIFLTIGAKAVIDDAQDWPEALLWAALALAFFFSLPKNEKQGSGGPGSGRPGAGRE